MKHQQVLIYKLYPAVQQGLCTLRGVHQPKSDGTLVPIVSPSNQHIGCVLDPSSNVKPVDEWDMRRYNL